MPPAFTHLVMSGGGLAALTYFGALRFLEIEGVYSTIRHVSGTSMGAIFSAAVALRIPLDVVEERVCTFMGDPDKNKINYPDLMNVFHEMGLDDVRRFIDVLRPEINQLTFLDLSKKTGMNLVICATHIPSFEPTYFSVDTTPHVLVADAVRASAAVPWLFKPVLIGNDLYIDGGVTNNVPYQPFENIPKHSILVMHVTVPLVKLETLEPISYTMALVSKSFSQLSMVPHLKAMFPYYVIFDKSPLPFMTLSLQPDVLRIKLTKEELDRGISYGYEITYNTLRPFMQQDPP